MVGSTGLFCQSTLFWPFRGLDNGANHNPPLRGTYFSIENQAHLLYTMGFIPYLETYPGLYVPRPWQIIDHHGGSAPKDLFKELLALTKMNVNNCSFADGTPITLSFSSKIGEIMKHVPADGKVQPKYNTN